MAAYRQTPPCLVEKGELHSALYDSNRDWGATVSGETVIRRSALGVDATGQAALLRARRGRHGPQPRPRDEGRGRARRGGARRQPRLPALPPVRPRRGRRGTARQLGADPGRAVQARGVRRGSRRSATSSTCDAVGRRRRSGSPIRRPRATPSPAAGGDHRPSPAWRRCQRRSSRSRRRCARVSGVNGFCRSARRGSGSAPARGRPRRSRRCTARGRAGGSRRRARSELACRSCPAPRGRVSRRSTAPSPPARAPPALPRRRGREHAVAAPLQHIGRWCGRRRRPRRRAPSRRRPRATAARERAPPRARPRRAGRRRERRAAPELALDLDDARRRLTIPYTVARPSPAPSPSRLRRKNGRTGARACRDPSRCRCRSPRARRREGPSGGRVVLVAPAGAKDLAAGLSPGSPREVSTTSLPPSASRRARHDEVQDDLLQLALPTLIEPRSRSTFVCRSMSSPMRRYAHVCMSSTTALMSSTSRCSALRRLIARSCRVSAAAARSPAFVTWRAPRRSALSGPRRRTRSPP